MPELPTIDVQVNTGRKKPGMNLVSYWGSQNPQLPQLQFMFHQYGHIRWYANLDTHPALFNLFYHMIVARLQNGNLYFGDWGTSHIYEMDMLGRIMNKWPMPGFSFHHYVIELPNGNFLVTVNKKGLSTREDHVIEIDRETGMIVTVWDLRESLDSRRLILHSNPSDWFHGNGLAYDQEKDEIIVSGRFQGTVKLTRNNEVVWILAPHRGWGQSGNGTDLKTKLLQPVDANARPITDLRVVGGYTDHSEFSWAWHQHSPMLTQQGTLFLFDNGDRRNYSIDSPFSRAVEYQIDEDAMTIQQVWEYGRERGRSTYASAASAVDFHYEENTVAFMPGNNHEYGINGKTIEIDYRTKEVVYEAILRGGDVRFFMFLGIDRLPIYPRRY